MNRYRKNDKAVSPVIATILMVAITVVLAGVLVVYLQTLPQGGGGAENPVGLSVQRSGIDWLISVSSGGGQALGDVTMVVTNATSGASAANVKLNALGADGTYNDNNADSKLNSGDSLLLKYTYAATSPPTGVGFGMKVQMLKGERDRKSVV
jgi:flagellin-like protein